MYLTIFYLGGKVMNNEKINTFILAMIFVVLLFFTYSQWNIGRYVPGVPTNMLLIDSRTGEVYSPDPRDKLEDDFKWTKFIGSIN